MKYLWYIILIVFFTGIRQSNACIAFCLVKDGKIYLAKNLDWEIGSGYVFLNEPYTFKSLPENYGSFTWESKYRSITFNQFGKEFPLGGMNECGLVVEELNMSPVDIFPDNSKQPMNEFQFTQYILDTYGSVDELVEHINEFQLKPLLLSLHYLVADRTGKTLILEFNGNDFSCFFPDEKAPAVLSNNNYSESLRYLKNFRGFGGDMPVMNRPGSNERFVLASSMLNDYDNQLPVNYAFGILDSVSQEDTRWSIVYDIENLSVNFRIYSCPDLKIFDFSKAAFVESVNNFGADLTDCSLNSISGLHKVTPEENTFLLQEVFNLYTEKSGIEIYQSPQEQMAAIGNKNL